MRYLSILLLILLVSPVHCLAQEAGLSFLQVGNDYAIEFPAQLQAFTKKTSSVQYGKVGEKRFPVTTELTHVVTAFRVHQVGPSQWVLLEHPSSLEDASTWNAKLASAAKLIPPNVAKLESTEEGRKRLETLRTLAGNSVETTKTWVNLSHAVAISPLPTEDKKPKISVNVSVNSRKSE